MDMKENTDNVAKLENRIQLLSIIGEVEGHETLGERAKTTKYEQILPRLAMVEDDDSVDGLLILLNTVGGDVEAGLAIAEMIASLSKPTVSLVLVDGDTLIVHDHTAGGSLDELSQLGNSLLLCFQNSITRHLIFTSL